MRGLLTLCKSDVCVTWTCGCGGARSCCVARGKPNSSVTLLLLLMDICCAFPFWEESLLRLMLGTEGVGVGGTSSPPPWLRRDMMSCRPATVFQSGNYIFSGKFDQDSIVNREVNRPLKLGRRSLLYHSINSHLNMQLTQLMKMKHLWRWSALISSSQLVPTHLNVSLFYSSHIFRGFNSRRYRLSRK